jgi:hypothetical protein
MADEIPADSGLRDPPTQSRAAQRGNSRASEGRGTRFLPQPVLADRRRNASGLESGVRRVEDPAPSQGSTRARPHRFLPHRQLQ